MRLFGKTRDAVKKELGGKGSFLIDLYRSAGRAARPGTDDGSEVDMGRVDEKTFRRRYGNARINAFIAAAFLFGSLLFTLAAATALAYVPMLLFGTCSALFGLLYLHNAFRLWVARGLLENWREGRTSRRVELRDFFAAARADFAEALPLEAPESVGAGRKVAATRRRGEMRNTR